MKIISTVLKLAMIFCILWIAISFFDIAADNNTIAEHSNWNIITILLEMGD